MVDDQTQRPYRSNPMPASNALGTASAIGSSGNDPLAELARLIGQNDPFAEYGRQNAAQRPAAPMQPPPAPSAPPTAPQWRAQAPAAYASPAGGPPPAPEMHPAEYAPPAYGAHGYVEEAGEYEQHAYDPNMAPMEGEHQDFHDDVPPRRRMGIMAIAAVFVLAVVGTAGAVGYRALFGSSGSSGPPPVIKADTKPSKVVPAKDKDAKNGKLIYDRVTDKGENQKLVSREEQPVDMNNKPAGVVMPRDENGTPSGSIQPALGSGVVGAEPKKIHTIAIRPDGTVVADAASGPIAPSPAPAAAPAAPPLPPTANAAPAPSPRPAQPTPAPAPWPAVTHGEPAPRHVAVEERHTAPPPPRNAPLSLNPNAPEPPRRVERTTQPMRTASAAQPMQTATAAHTAQASASGGSGYAVQLASSHNEADAQSSFHSLQAKYPQQLGGRQPLIRRVDLGTKGVYYRAMVGPFGSSDEASQLCSSIKASGGTCFVQRI